MSDKDKVKIFTGSGTFKLPENKTETKKQTEKVHVHCGTPDCCGECKQADDLTYENEVSEVTKQSAYAHIKRKIN